MIIFILFPALACSQVDKGFKLLATGNMQAAWEAFSQVAQDDKEHTYALFGQSQVLGNQAFNLYNLDSAYHYLALSEAAYRQLAYKDRKKLEPFTISEIRKWQKDLQKRVVVATFEGRDPKRVDEVMVMYKRLSSGDKRLLMENRNSWLWEVVREAQLPDFFHRYRADFATYSPALLRDLEKRLFDWEIGPGGWDKYPDFVQSYPNHSYVLDGLMDKVDALKGGRDPKAYFAFLDQYGKTPFRTLVLDSLASAVAYRGNLADSKRYVEQLADELPSEAVWRHYYNLYKRYDFSEAAIQAFIEKYPSYPFPEHLEKDLNFFVERKFEALTTNAFSVTAANAFLDLYPAYPGVEKLWQRYYKVYRLTNPSPDDIHRFGEENPAYPFPDSLETERLTLIDMRADGLLKNEAVGVRGYLAFMQKYPETSRGEVIWRRIYMLSIEQQPGISALENFARKYPTYPFMNELEEEKKKQVDEKGVSLLENNDATALVCLDFINQYPESVHTQALWRKIYRLHNEKMTSATELEAFQSQYPNYPFMEEIEADIQSYNRRYEKECFEQIVDIRRAFDFLKDYPNSSYLKALEESMYKMLAGSSRKFNLVQFLEYYPQSRYRQQILKQIYTTSTSSGTLVSVTDFEEKYPDFEDRVSIERDKALAGLPNMINVRYRADKKADFEQYIRQAAPGHRAYRVLFQYIYSDILKEDWAAAGKKVKAFQSDFDDENENYNELLTILEESNVYNMNPMSISDSVNTLAEEYAPVISVDGQTLLFCGRFRKDNLGKEDIFIAKKVRGEWQLPELLRDLSSSVDNEAPEALSADNNTMIVFVDGELGISEKTVEGWGTMQKLPTAINRSHWQADARITADGKAMLFASEDGEYGSRDIYVSLKDEKGDWEKAINLGPVINTAEVDRTPFLHPDMKTLYFSSVGHTGLGKMDVFMSKRLDENSWTQWSKPINLGTAVNSTGNDWDFKVTTDGIYAYFTINNDILLAELPQAFRPEKVATVSGQLSGIDGKPLAAEIVWQDLETGEVVQVSKSDPQTGAFFVTLPKKGVFGYTVKREDYFPLSGNVDFTESIGNVQLEKEMTLATIEQMEEEDIRLPLNNLFFETAKYDIKPRSFPELNRLAEWIDLYDLRIEILGHTDDVGEEADNQLLSQNRSDAVKAYLLERGVSAKRIIAIGFGESQPVATNETLEGRAVNRRVEIRIRK